MKRKSFLLFLLGLAGVAVLSQWPIFEPYELALYDWRSGFHKRTHSKNIILIEIEESTLQSLGAWPIPRHAYAYLIRNLNQLGVKWIVFDLIFSEPTRSDGFLSHEAGEAGNVLFSNALIEPEWNGKIWQSKGDLAPLRENLRLKSSGKGFVNVRVDVDGKMRRVIPAVDVGGQPQRHLAFETFRKIQQLEAKDIRQSPTGQFLDFGKKRIPLDGQGSFLIRFAGPWAQTFQHYSLIDLIQDSSFQSIQNKQLFKDAICLVGLTATGSSDFGATPLERIYPLVGLHANAIDALIHQDYLFPVPVYLNWLVVCFLAIGAFYCSRHFKPLISLGLFLGGLGIFVVLNTYLFCAHGIWVILFYPIVSSTAVYTAGLLHRILFYIRREQKLETDMRAASLVQESFLPLQIPNISGLKIEAFIRQSKMVGGDFYLLEVFSPKHLAVILGDVSGKGVPAALFMAKVVQEARHVLQREREPARFVSRLNSYLAENCAQNLFVTLTYAIFDLERREMVYTSAGHLPIVRVNQEGHVESLNSSIGLPLAIDAKSVYESLSVPLKEGDIYLFYSDGLTESANSKGELFGQSAFMHFLKTSPKHSLKNFCVDLQKASSVFSKNHQQQDDLTLVGVQIQNDL